jgi:amidophosphoribosyltransferase
VYGHAEAARPHLPRAPRAHSTAGQESAGIATRRRRDGRDDHVAPRRWGSCRTCSTPSSIAKLPGDVAIGHVRYSTAGGSHVKQRAALRGRARRHPSRCAHNGNLTNTDALKRRPRRAGRDLSDHHGHRGVLHLIAPGPAGPVVDRSVARALRRCAGRSRSSVPRGRHAGRRARPARVSPALASGSSTAPTWWPASPRPSTSSPPSSCARHRARRGAGRSTREGCARCGRSSPRRRASASSSTCTSRAPTRVPRRARVYATRKRDGAAPRAREPPSEADVVIPVPDSGVPAAIGYAEAAAPLSDGPDPLALRRAHVHRAAAVHPSLRRAAEAQPRARGAAGQARDRRRRLHRARHDLAQDREDAARRGGARGAPAHLVAAHALAVLLRHRHAHRRELIAASHSSKRSPATSPPTRSRTCRWRACAARWAEATSGAGFCEACFTGDYPIPLVSPDRLVRG